MRTSNVKDSKLLTHITQLHLLTSQCLQHLCLFSFAKFFPLKGFRTCHPKICCFGILTILSWRDLRNSRYGKCSVTSSFSSQKQIINFPTGKMPSGTYTRSRRPFLSPETGSWCWKGHVQANLLRWHLLSSVSFHLSCTSWSLSHNLLPLPQAPLPCHILTSNHSLCKKACNIWT